MHYQNEIIMKNKIFIFSVILTLLSACSGIKTSSRGLENEAFLELIGDPIKMGQVEVIIDNETPFLATVNKPNRKVKGQVYAIKNGRSELIIRHKNNIIYKQTIFVSPQETKRIILQ